MAAPIYPNCRLPDRDKLVVDAHARLNIAGLAEQFELSETTIRTILKREAEQKAFELSLVRPGERPVSVATVVTHKGFLEACLGAYRHFGDFFRGLDLPDWSLTDGKSTCTINAIRDAIAARHTPSAETMH